ncbi:MAG: hypothetical protein Tsb005_14540 [Gammaproteobacteria bacterium]
MFRYPFHLICGDTLGLAHTSWVRNGELVPGMLLGQAQLFLATNMSNGNLVVRSLMHTAVFYGRTIELTYYYNSQAKQLWNFPIRRLVAPDEHANSVTVIDPDGGEITYTKVPNRYYYRAPATGHGYQVLSHGQFPDGAWHYYDMQTGVSEYYSAKGLLQVSQDAQGHRIIYRYDNYQRLIQIAPENDQQTYDINYTTEGNNVVASFYHNDGYQKTLLQRNIFAPDKTGKHTQLIKVETNVDKYTLQTVCDYTYYGNNQLIKLQQADGTVTNLMYDESYHMPRLIKLMQGDPHHSADYDFAWPEPGKATLDSPLMFNALTIYFDGAQRITELQMPSGVPPVGSPMDITRYTYNTEGQLTQTITPDAATTRYSYDAVTGLIRELMGPNGQRTTWLYDPQTGDVQQKVTWLNPESSSIHPLPAFAQRYFLYDVDYKTKIRFLRFEIDEAGCVTEYIADAFNNRKSQRRYTRNSYVTALQHNAHLTVAVMEAWAKQQLAQYPHDCQLIEYKYDAQGQVASSTAFSATLPNGQGDRSQDYSEQLQTWTYFGALQTSTQSLSDQQNIVTAIFYDTRQRLTLKTVQSTDLKTQHITTYAYTETKDVAEIKTTLPNGRIQLTQSNTLGYINKRIDAVGQQQRITTVGQDRQGREGVITHPNGAQTYQYFDAQNRLLYSVDSLGRVDGYTYDAQTNVTAMTHYANTVDVAKLVPNELLALKDQLRRDNDQDRTAYTIKDHSGRIRFTIDTERYVTEFQYDIRDNEIEKIQYATQLSIEQVMQLVHNPDTPLPKEEAQDRRWSTRYDDANRKIVTINPAGYVTRYVYTLSGLCAQKIIFFNPITWAQRAGKLPEKPTAEDLVTDYQYDGRRLLTRQTNAENVTETHSYYRNNAQRETIEYAQPQLNSAPTRDPNDHHTTYGYDTFGREANISLPLAVQKIKRYDNMDQVLEETTADSTDLTVQRTQQNRYDSWQQLTAQANSRVSAEITAINNDPQLTPQQKSAKIAAIWQQSTERHQYDVNGLRTQTIDELNHTTLFYYDIANRKRFTIDAKGSIKEYSYTVFDEEASVRRYAQPLTADELADLAGGLLTDEIVTLLEQKRSDDDIITQKTYDKRSLLQTKTDALGYVTRYKQDAFKQTIQIIKPLASAAQTKIITQDFDQRSLLIKREQIVGNESIVEQYEYKHPLNKRTSYTDPLGNVTTQIWDKLGRLLKKILPPLDPDQPNNHPTIQYAYDAFNRIIQKIVKQGQIIRYQFTDSERRCDKQIVQKSNDANGTDQVLQTTRILRNAFGEIWQEIDAFGKVMITDYGPDGQREKVTDRLGFMQQWQFNLKGKRTTFIDKLGIKAVSHYDAVDQLIQSILDPEGLNLLTSYQYNALRQLSITIDPRATLIETFYDKRDQEIQRIVDRQGLYLVTQKHYYANSELQATHYGDNHDAYQRTLHQLLDIFGRKNGNVIDPDGLALTSQNTLDQKGRVVEIKNPNGVSTYQWFDALDNKRYTINGFGRIEERRYSDTGKVTVEMNYARTIQVEGLLTLAQLEARLIDEKLNPNNQARYIFYDARDLPVYEINSKGAITETRYNANFQPIVTYRYATAYPDLSQLATLTLSDIKQFCDANQVPATDRVTYRIVDAKGRERFVIKADRAIIENVYDAKDRIILEIEYANRVSDPQTLSQLPDTEVRARLTQDPNRDAWTYHVFDQRDKPWFVVSADHSVIGYEHDANGNQTQARQYATPIDTSGTYEDIVARLKTLPTTADDRIDHIQYDRADRKTQETDALGDYEQITWDALSQKIALRRKNGGVWIYEYDKGGRKTLELSPPIDVTVVAPSTQNAQTLTTTVLPLYQLRKEYTHDNASNMIKMTVASDTPEKRDVNFKYSGDNQPIETWQENIAVDDPDNTNPSLLLTQRPEKKLAKVSTYTIRDGKGNEVVTINEADVAQFKVYDSENNLRFHIRQDGGVTQYVRDTFGDLRQLIFYKQPLKNIDLNAYRTTGITLQEVQAYLPTDAETITKTFTYDSMSRKIEEQWDRILYYIPTDGEPEIEWGQPTTRYQYNAFGKQSCVAHLIDPVRDEWATQLTWYDNMKEPIVEVNPENYVTEHVYDIFGDLIAHTEYREPLPQTVSLDATVGEVLQHIRQVPGQRTIETRFSYDLRAQKISESILNVTYAVPDLSDPQKTNYRLIKDQTATKQWAYTATSKPKSITHEDGSQEFFIYNMCDHEIGHLGVARQQHLDDQGTTQTLIPYTQTNVNPHGQNVHVIEFANTAEVDGTTIRLPEASEQDRHTLRWMSERGLEKAKQLPNGATSQVTLTANKRAAREYHGVTNASPNITGTVPLTATQGINSFTKQTHIDQVTYGYDTNDQTVSQTFWRDGELQRAIVTQYNILLQSTAVGPNANTPKQVTKYDAASHPWFHNSKDGANTITLTDLRGNQTVDIQSGSIDLSQVEYGEDLRTKLKETWKDNIDDIERHETRYNRSRFPIAHYQPAFKQPHPATDTTIPIMVQTQQVYQFDNKRINLSWLLPANATITPHTITLTPQDTDSSADAKSFPVQYINDRCGINTQAVNSGLTTGVYHFKIDYRTNVALPQSTPQTYVSEGVLQFDQGYSANSHGIVAYTTLASPTTLLLAGQVADVTHVQLFRYSVVNDQPQYQAIDTLNVTYQHDTHQASVDLHTQLSDHYAIKAITTNGTQDNYSLPFTVYSDQVAADQAWITRIASIAQTQLTFIGFYGRIDWAFDGFINQYPLQIDISYQAPQSLLTQHVIQEITHATDYGTHISPMHQVLEHCNIKFDIPLATMVALTVSVKIYGEWVPVLRYTPLTWLQAPKASGAQPAVHVSSIHSHTTDGIPPQNVFTFDIPTVLYVRGAQTDTVSSPQLHYFDTSLDRNSVWKTATPQPQQIISAHSFVINDPGLTPGIYPFYVGERPTVPNAPALFIYQGEGLVFRSLSRAAREAMLDLTPSIVRPTTRVIVDGAGQELQRTDPRGQNTYKTWNKRDQLVAVETDPVVVMDDQGEPIVSRLPYRYLHDLRNRQIGEHDPRNHVKLNLVNSAGAIEKVWLPDGTREQLRSVNIFGDRVKLYDCKRSVKYVYTFPFIIARLAVRIVQQT